MADISMCKDETCPKKETCYRFTAIPDEYWQMYADFKYTTYCEHYWKTDFKPKKQII